MNDIDLRQRAEDMPLGVSLRIMSAPASFALPMVQRKPFKPPFQVCPAPQQHRRLALQLSSWLWLCWFFDFVGLGRGCPVGQQAGAWMYVSVGGPPIHQRTAQGQPVGDVHNVPFSQCT